MIISILAPKGGVGSSTLAVLLARARARSEKVLLVDAAGDRSLDLYTDTAHLLSGSYAGSIDDSAVTCRDLENLQVLRVEPGDGSLWPVLADELRSLEGTDVILDHGSAGEGEVAPLSFSDRTIVVLTQDNQVLRAADRLMGELRKQGREAAFIINMREDRDPTQLGGLEEIFDLFEEDHLGSISFQHGVRFAVNTGFTEALPEKTLQEAAELAAGIFGLPGSAPSLEPVAAFEESSAEAERPRSVLEGIRSFFRSFRKG